MIDELLDTIDERESLATGGFAFSGRGIEGKRGLVPWVEIRGRRSPAPPWRSTVGPTHSTARNVWERSADSSRVLC